MASIKQLVENKTTLPYEELCKALIDLFNVKDLVSFASVLPHANQQELFGGETLRLVADHPEFANQKDIRPICLMKGSVSQVLFFFVRIKEDTISKSLIQRITTRFIRGSEANRYIIWFLGNINETEFKVVLSGKEGKKIVLKTLPFGVHQPYYRTYDFILTEVQAKVNQLFVEPTDLWKALWGAFDISIINRRFYHEIKEAFDKLLIQLDTKRSPLDNAEEKVQFAIRLIGRILFCWFLKRKGILKEGALSSEAVKAHRQSNYYHNLLEVLFFDVLNQPEKDRKKNIPKILESYPFLNGGLFDAHETDYKDNLLINIENEWFEKFFGNTLEKYNFTVDENSSSNAEIAIDPEMLGRIFENLLAEQNPETGESARKATGSFYTPREIVDYMVEQSVIEYLKSSLALGSDMNEVIDDFIHTQQLPEPLITHEKIISESLSKIKVLDPACGSGAFPIGMLQKIVALKQQLHPRTRQYQLKLDTIQNSIFGVDIQPMAVELSRLRCWLSLVVDEDPNEIKALPNLDFKFVCADSLVDVPDDEYVKNLSAKHLADLASATQQYFNPDFQKKDTLKVEIRRCLAEIVKTHDIAISGVLEQIRIKKHQSANASQLKKLNDSLLEYAQKSAKWHSFLNIFSNRKVDFFNIHYFFPSVKNGFDIVIGNPPYAQISKGIYSKYLFPFSEGKDKGKQNYYKLFVEQSYNLLNENKIATMIVQSSLLCDYSSQFTRELMLTKTQVIKVLEFPKKAINKEGQVFNSVLQGTCIYLPAVKRLEQLQDPKRVLEDLIIQCSGLSKRRLNYKDNAQVAKRC